MASQTLAGLDIGGTWPVVESGADALAKQVEEQGWDSSVLGEVAPGNRFTRSYQQLDEDPTRSRDVDWISGAALWLRREAVVEIGGWDEGYFMYLEDVDLVVEAYDEPNLPVPGFWHGMPVSPASIAWTRSSSSRSTPTTSSS